MTTNIKLKIKNWFELEIMETFLLSFWQQILKSNNNSLLTKSILEDITIKIQRKILSKPSKCTISLKLHEAIIIQELWKLTTPDYTQYNTNVILQWMNFINKEIEDLRSRNVSETFLETLLETLPQR